VHADVSREVDVAHRAVERLERIGDRDDRRARGGAELVRCEHRHEDGRELRVLARRHRAGDLELHLDLGGVLHASEHARTCGGEVVVTAERRRLLGEAEQEIVEAIVGGDVADRPGELGGGGPQALADDLLEASRGVGFVDPSAGHERDERGRRHLLARLREARLEECLIGRHRRPRTKRRGGHLAIGGGRSNDRRSTRSRCARAG